MAEPSWSEGYVVDLDYTRRYFRAVITAAGLKLRKGDQALESPADIQAHVKDRARFFFSDFLPFLRKLGVAD